MPEPPPPARRRRVDVRLVAIAACAALLVGIASGLVASFASGGTGGDGDDPAPPATDLTDLAGSGEGDFTEPVERLFGDGTFRFADFAGKPMVVNFFSTTCAPCVREMPLLEAAHQQLGEQVTFVGIDVTDTKENGQDLVRRTGVTYLTGYDPAADLVRAFGGTALPTTVLVDAAGQPVDVYSGELEAGEIERLLEEAGLLPA